MNRPQTESTSSNRLALLVVAGGLALFAGLMLSGPLGGPDLATSVFAADDHALVGKPAPAFAVETLDGRRASLKEAQGAVLVLDFWATWCPPCVKALPIIKSTVESYADSEVKVHLVAMNLREDKRTIRAFLDQQKLQGINVGMDTTGAVAEKYLVTGIPQTVVIDPTGKVQAVHVGLSPNLGATLKADIDAALAAAEATASAE